MDDTDPAHAASLALRLKSLWPLLYLAVGVKKLMKWADAVSLEEVEYTLACADAMANVPHAKPLLQDRTMRQILTRMRQGMMDRRAYAANPLVQGETPFLFEIRFAHELMRRGIDFEYEFETGVGKSSVDFKIDIFSQTFLVELVKFHVSEAISGATSTDEEGISSVFLSSKASGKATEEYEMLNVQDKLLKKCYDRKRKLPIKFAAPTPRIYHVLMVDARGYLGLGSGDLYDWRQIANGPRNLHGEMIHFDPNTSTPIRGVFEPEYPYNQEAAKLFRERIHLIGFVIEKDFRCEGEIQRVAQYTSNPLLFKTEAEYNMMWDHWALS
jgi:hypothetical protein